MDSWCGCSTIITSSNLTSVKAFGEFEFWFAMIKVVTIVLMIIAGFGLIFFGIGNGGHAIGISNMVSWWIYAKWIRRFLLCIINCYWFYQGVELIGITAGETKDPQKISKVR